MTATGRALRCSGTLWPAASRRPTARIAPQSAICSKPSGRGSMAVGHYHRRGDGGPPGAPIRRSPAAGRGQAINLKPARELLVLSQADVQRLLDLDELVDAMAAAFAELSAARTSVPPRGAARTRSGVL